MADREPETIHTITAHTGPLRGLLGLDDIAADELHLTDGESSVKLTEHDGRVRIERVDE